MSWPQSVQGAEGSSCSCGFVRASVPFQVALSTGFVLPHHGRPALLSRRALAGIYTCGRLYVQLDFKHNKSQLPFLEGNAQSWHIPTSSPLQCTRLLPQNAPSSMLLHDIYFCSTLSSSHTFIVAILP